MEHTEHTYRIEVVPGWSPYDHLAPLITSDTMYASLADARAAIRSGCIAQGQCASKARRVRCDIVRNDGRRLAWQG